MPGVEPSVAGTAVLGARHPSQAELSGKLVKRIEDRLCLQCDRYDVFEFEKQITEVANGSGVAISWKSGVASSVPRNSIKSHSSKASFMMSRSTFGGTSWRNLTFFRSRGWPTTILQTASTPLLSSATGNSWGARRTFGARAPEAARVSSGHWRRTSLPWRLQSLSR